MSEPTWNPNGLPESRCGFANAPGHRPHEMTVTGEWPAKANRWCIGGLPKEEATAEAEQPAQPEEPAEPRYTLAEARMIVAREQCDQFGHALSNGRVYGAGGQIEHVVTCVRCGAAFTEVGR